MSKKRVLTKYHFLKVYRRYVIGAEEEAHELCRARSIDEQTEELGDVMFYLLHFFKSAELDIDDLNDLLSNRESLSGQRIIRSSPPLARVNGRALVSKAVRDMRNSVDSSHYLLFGGPLSFGDQKEDAPWLDPGSEQWTKFKKETTYRWIIAFSSVMDLADQIGVDMVEVVQETSEKAARNYPRIFFQPDFSWFSSEPNGDESDVALCRLFRDIPIEGSGNYLSLFREEDGCWFTPESFRLFVRSSLEYIAQFPDDRSNQARFLLNKIDYIQQSISGGNS